MMHEEPPDTRGDAPRTDPPPGSGAVPPPPPGAPPPPSEPPRGIPWERRHEIGFLNALFQTISASLLHPTEFFRNLHPDGPTPPPPLGAAGGAALYGVLIAVPSAVIGLFWQVLFSWIQIALGDGNSALFDLGTTLFLALLTPILVPLVLVIGAAIVHLLLMIMGGANQSLQATFRVLCYSSAPDLFQLVPLCGSLVSVVWGTVLIVVGLTEVHKTTWPRALGAVLLPFILCCGVFVFTIFGVAIFGSSH